MSHATGRVTFPDGLVMHCEYNATAGIVRPFLYETRYDMCKNWVTGPHEGECECGQDEQVVAEIDYGYGFACITRACRHCSCIIEFLDPDECDEVKFR